MSPSPAVPGIGTAGTATAIAHPNIAIIKYWGKRDDARMLPATGSISLTLDVFPTTTTVTVDSTLGADAVEFDGQPASDTTLDRITAFLDIVRERAAHQAPARVTTRNSVPTGAGLASSASGFAALAVAASAAYGLDLDRPGLSRLARLGSGSACRSVIDGVAIWHAGDGVGASGSAGAGADGSAGAGDGNDDVRSFAEPLPAPELGMVVVIVDAGAKKVSSREAMRSTRETSPYYDAWVRSTTEDLDAMRAALAAGDIQAIGELTESNALRMHAAIAGSRPPVRYLTPESLRVFDLAEQLRQVGVAAYATADAGPNVVLLTRLEDVDAVRDAAIERLGLDGSRVVAARPGLGARLIDEGAAA